MVSTLGVKSLRPKTSAKHVTRKVPAVSLRIRFSPLRSARVRDLDGPRSSIYAVYNFFSVIKNDATDSNRLSSLNRIQSDCCPTRVGTLGTMAASRMGAKSNSASSMTVASGIARASGMPLSAIEASVENILSRCQIVGTGSRVETQSQPEAHDDNSGAPCVR